VHVALLVICGRILLETFGDYLVVDDHRLSDGGGLFEQVEDVEQLACVSSREAEQGGGLLHFHIPLAQYLVAADGAVEQHLQLGCFKWLEGIDLGA